ncbi:NAD(P)-dependent oxidoreductase [Actinotalea solisilvae]|uniref:NAD(P)-dependent oxidoreductase n=1 Tax=Actinotalea solisilvae TaxID=2072922 RepID=UPI0018F2040F|nr:NAD(P)-dependent oxidoreductase [Actinotalea solisilvae]
MSFDWVHSMGAGVDAFIDHAGQIGVLTRTLGAMPERMGAFVLALVLGRAHHLREYALSQDVREWRPLPPEPLPRRAAILGTGVVASGVARALTGQGIAVTGVNRSGRTSPHFSAVVPWGRLEDALRDCSLVVAALPASSSTYRIIGEDVLGQLRSAHLVNVGRGSTLDLAALGSALASGTVVHADLDVFDHEPLDNGSWLWAHPAVRVTPHVAAVTAVEDAVDAIASTWADLRASRLPATLVTRPG